MGTILNSSANTAALERLAGVLSTKSPLALIGAGISVDAGFPIVFTLLLKTSAEFLLLHEK